MTCVTCVTVVEFGLPCLFFSLPVICLLEIQVFVPTPLGLLTKKNMALLSTEADSYELQIHLMQSYNNNKEAHSLNKDSLLLPQQRRITD